MIAMAGFPTTRGQQVEVRVASSFISLEQAMRNLQEVKGRSFDEVRNDARQRWNDVLGRAFEISSMGIRVDAESLDRQLTLAGCDDRRGLLYHRMLLAGELPLTIGGGIGQSRLCMLMLGCAHIGEVQSSIWDEDTRKTCADAGVMLL